ncbi:hypothetical protein ABMY26_00095 (plasmid) [Azospirillum sp. HJ39]|uniref:hypothetical protein n=1 Tax=Azospirillum sp. HJ39 TaxID=3159496 RepID=UPI003555FEAF
MTDIKRLQELAAPFDPGVPEFRTAGERGAFYAGLLKARFDFMGAFLATWLGQSPGASLEEKPAIIINAVADGFDAVNRLLPAGLQDVTDAGHS